MIVLDGKRISEFGFDADPMHEDPITPIFEHKLMHIPGRPGAWDFGSEIKERPFSFNLRIHERFHDNMQQAFNELVAFLFDEFGKPREVKVVREYEPDKFITAKVMEAMIPERLTDEGELLLPFVAVDPYKYSNVFADEVYWGSQIVTFEYHYLLGREGINGSVKITSPQTINVKVDGIAVQPVFEIDGTANNLKIESGKYSFTLPNFNNAKWVIDFERYTVTRNGQHQFIDDINEFYLMPGSNEVKITGSNINMNVKIKFRDKFN